MYKSPLAGRENAKMLSSLCRKSEIRLAMWSFGACFVILHCLSPASAAISCSAVKSILETRGMPSADLLSESVTGSSSGYCSGVLAGSCCGSATQFRLLAHSRTQLDAQLRDQLTRVSGQLANRANKFDSFFRELLAQSKREFHEMFTRTYGMIYERHSYVFTDLFAELERYYTRGDVNLAHAMDTFFSVLYQKMFTVLNSQYHFDDKYLHCVNEHMKELQPFGDVPHKLSVQLRRAFVATRTFQRALQAGADVIRNMIGIHMSAECATAAAAMQWCGVCSAAEEPRVCPRFCLNTLRACFTHHADLAADWDAYVDALDKVADRLLGPFNIAMVVEPIDIKISEAIMNFQEHSQELSQRVFTGCGKPILGQRPTDTGTYFAPPQKRDRRSIFKWEKAHGYDGFDFDPTPSDDFEIETSYESLLNRNPSMRTNDRDDEFSNLNLAKSMARRYKTLHSLRSVNAEHSESREKREANPEPARNSKEIDFEPYDFNDNNPGGRRKGGKRRPSGKKNEEEDLGATSEEESATETGENGNGSGGVTLERLVGDARSRVRNTKRFWSLLPHSLCNERSTAADQGCFNGTAVGTYEHPAAGEGSAAIATNPESRGSNFGSSPILMAQQFTLRSVAAKLKNAYNGQEVEWKDYDDTSSLAYGSGSGSGDDEDDTEDSYPPDMEDDLEGSGRPPTEVIKETEKDYDTEEPEAPRSGLDEVFHPSVVINKVNAHKVEISGPRHEGEHHTDLSEEEPSVDSVETNGKESADRSGAPQQMSLRRALVTYLFPIVCVWLGGIVSDIL